MARKLFVAGNWKMNTSASYAVELAKGLAAELGEIDAVDLAVCPPSVYLSAVCEALKGSNIAVGAQNMYCEDNGAFTGEISTAMVKDVGCKYVILGHSERRHVMGESDELINSKVLKALSDDVLPIFCIGELLEQRETGETDDVLSRQLKIGLEGVSRTDAQRITLAYEPVWAIGTGVTATPDQAQKVHAMLRELIENIYDAELADSIRIQYGGSVKASNAAELLGQPDVDGALVGGASLKVEDFVGIVKAVI